MIRLWIKKMIISGCLAPSLQMIHNRNMALISHFRKKDMFQGYHQLKPAKIQQGNFIDIINYIIIFNIY